MEQSAMIEQIKRSLIEQLKRYPRSIEGIRRLQRRNPIRYIEFTILQHKLQSLVR